MKNYIAIIYSFQPSLALALALALLIPAMEKVKFKYIQIKLLRFQQVTKSYEKKLKEKNRIICTQKKASMKKEALID